jgi:Mrp family chromosome partitioning ATPase
MSAKEEFLNRFRVKPNDRTHIRRIIAVVSGKGGVGKSSLTALSAVLLQRQGKQAGILDADVTGPSIPRMFGLNGALYADQDQLIIPAQTATGIRVVSSNLLVADPTTPVIWRAPIVTQMIQQFYSEVAWGDLDVLLIDMPPGTSDVPLTVYQSFPVDGVLIVTTPQALVSMIVEKAVKMARQMEIPILGVVRNMSYVTCPHCGNKVELFPEGGGVEDDPIPVLAELPMDGSIARAADEGKIETLELPGLETLTEALLKA